MFPVHLQQSSSIWYALREINGLGETVVHYPQYGGNGFYKLTMPSQSEIRKTLGEEANSSCENKQLTDTLFSCFNREALFGASANGKYPERELPYFWCSDYASWEAAGYEVTLYDEASIIQKAARTSIGFRPRSDRISDFCECLWLEYVSKGDLVLYYKSLYNVTHYGIIESKNRNKIMVRSKWGSVPYAFVHEINAVPDYYGDCVKFIRVDRENLKKEIALVESHLSEAGPLKDEVDAIQKAYDFIKTREREHFESSKAQISPIRDFQSTA